MKKYISLATAVVIFSGCAVSENIGKIGGTTIGSATGAIFGKQVGGKKGMFLGALIGGSIGYLIGSEIDERKKAIQKIVDTKKDTKVKFKKIEDADGKTVGQSYMISSVKSQFDSGKYKLNPYAKDMFEKIAKQYAKSNMKIMIVGHTDADGSDTYNQKLSEKRAKTIAKLFEKNGVKIDNIYYKGSGEIEPIAQNNTRKGKALNRRVEIVEVANEEMLSQYALNKKINTALRPKEKISLNKPKKQTPSLQKGGSKKATKLPLDMSGAKQGTPLLAGTNQKKFATDDKNGKKGLTGVNGGYYVSQKNTKDTFGSCNNEYAYSKKSTLNIDGQKTEANKNELLKIIGYPEQESVFSLTTPAVADENLLAYYGSCMSDKPKKSGEVKKLSTGEVVLAKENYNLAPLLNGTTWGAEIDGEFIMINPVGVNRANMLSVSCPELNIIKNGSNQPWYGTSTKIISYNGQKGLLYRIYPEDKSKVECIDIAYPHGNPQDAQGVVYYKDKNGAIYQKKVKFISANDKGSL